MADFDGVGRVFRKGPDVRPDKHKAVSRTDREKRRKEEAATGDEPRDTVELHTEDAAPVDEEEESASQQDQPDEEEGFDISA